VQNSVRRLGTVPQPFRPQLVVPLQLAMRRLPTHPALPGDFLTLRPLSRTRVTNSIRASMLLRTIHGNVGLLAPYDASKCHPSARADLKRICPVWTSLAIQEAFGVVLRDLAAASHCQSIPGPGT